MLVKKIVTGHAKSKYKCDKCGKDINTDDEKRFRIVVMTPRERTQTLQTLKKYDLCKHCTLRIVNYIRKEK